MTIASGSSGIGDGVLAYNLAENESGEDRWAVIAVGESFFRVRQPPLPPILLPFAEWPRPSRWRLEDSAGGSRIAVTSEGPEAAPSLMLERRNPPDPDAEATAVSFSGVNIESGAGYRLSLWLKAEHPALVRVRFGQKASPFNLCGLDQPIDASPQWREVSVWFQARGEGCGPDENRLSIEAGQVSGKLWLAGVALGKESLADHAAEQGEGER
jgi:hypothetical protein